MMPNTELSGSEGVRRVAPPVLPEKRLKMIVLRAMPSRQSRSPEDRSPEDRGPEDRGPEVEVGPRE